MVYFLNAESPLEQCLFLSKYGCAFIPSQVLHMQVIMIVGICSTLATGGNGCCVSARFTLATGGSGCCVSARFTLARGGSGCCVSARFTLATSGSGCCVSARFTLATGGSGCGVSACVVCCLSRRNTERMEQRHDRSDVTQMVVYWIVWTLCSLMPYPILALCYLSLMLIPGSMHRSCIRAKGLVTLDNILICGEPAVMILGRLITFVH